MKRLSTCTILSIAVGLLAAGPAAFAAGVDEAIYGQNGKPLLDAATAAGSGYYYELNGTVEEASFRHPAGVAVLSDGTVLVSDSGNHRIRGVANGEVGVYAGTELVLLRDDAGNPLGALADGLKENSFFNNPQGLDVDAAGNIYVVDSGNHAVRRIGANGEVATVAGNGVLGSADGVGTEASFYAPGDVAVAEDGSLYVADTLNHTIRKIDPEGNVTTLSGTPERAVEIFPGSVVEAGDYRDGALSQALFNEPGSLVFDESGNLYVSDTGNQRIRYIDLAAGTVTTVAGGSVLEGGALYAEGSLYADGGFVDGSGADARFYSPRGLAVDAQGGLLIADSMNHVVRYFKDGVVTTIAGGTSAEYGYSNGSEDQTRFDFPADVALAPNGDIVVADLYNNRIRTLSYYTLPDGWSANGTIQVLLNNERISLDAQPEIRNGRTMVPVRAIAEALGYEVAFEGTSIVLDGEGQTIGLVVGEMQVERTIGGKATEREIDAAPFIEESRTYVPIRFFAEEIGLDVEWHAPTTTVVLRGQ